MTLLVYYGSGFVVPGWTEAGPEPAEWNRNHVRNWTGFPSLIPSTYLSAVERAVIHSDQSWRALMLTTSVSFAETIRAIYKLSGGR
jgi:hypothetical protein